MESHEVKNYRMIKVSYLSPTNERGSRIKIWESKRYNDDKTRSKVFSYDYSIGDVLNQALNILEKNGFNVVCRASELDYYIVLCDNCGEDFKEITDLK